jgi:zinc/manganese transport system substrate-binding protein
MMTSRTAFIWTIPLGIAALGLSACGSTSDSAAPTETPSEASALSVVATTTVLGSVTADIVECAGGTVQTIMPAGADPHDFAPSSAQVAEIVKADVVVANGLTYEQGLIGALDSARSEGTTVIEVGDFINPIEFGAGGHAHSDEKKDDDHGHEDDDHGHEEDDHGHEEDDHGHEEDDHGHGDLDPHFWFDMNRMADAAELIGSELALKGGAKYSECADTVATEIRAAESEFRAIIDTIPADRRILITDHEALGYLAEEYDFEIAGTVIPGGSTLGEPSSADLKELVEIINAEGISVIFTNSSEPTVLADAVAAEANSDVDVVVLYVESLGAPGSGADTYVTMMLTNAQLLADALRD